MFSSMIAAFTLYFTILLSIGFYFYNKNKNMSDFSLANRSLNYWITAISAQASDMSDWLFMAYPGLVFIHGLSQIWVAVGLVLFMFLTWHYIAPELRIQTEQLKVLTLSEFFEKKFHDTNNNIKIISGIFCLYFFVFYIAAGLVGLGRIFEIAFNIEYYSGIILGLLIALLYTLMGGLFAIAWSNLLQGTFLLACIVFVPYYATMHLGGFSQVHQSLQIFGPDYLSLWPQGGIITTIFAILSWGIGYFGQPHILINFMGIDDPENLKKAKLVGLSWQITVLLAAIAVGMVGNIMLFPTLANQELVFIVMVKQLFNPFLAGIILCAILAATISTINIQALISSSLITNDLYVPLAKKSISDNNKLLFSRLAIFIIPLFSLIVAWQANSSDSVLKLVLYAWSGLGSAFGPIVILSLYFSQYLNRTGVLAGLIAGGITALVWPFILTIMPTTIPTLVAGFLINGIMALGVSKITTKYNS